MAAVRSLVDDVPYGSIHLVALERTNVEAEFASPRPLESGWDGTPMLQGLAARRWKKGELDRLEEPELANKTTFADFGASTTHGQRRSPPARTLRGQVGGLPRPEKEAQRVFDFLGIERGRRSKRARTER